jgi:hypothetical protein
MREIQDMTDEEILALTDEEIKRMVDFQCAVKGVKLLEPPVKPEITYPPKDLALWEVDSLTFKEESEANKVAELLNNCYLMRMDYSYPPGSDHRYGVPVDDVCITPRKRMVYSKATFDKLREELAAISDQQKVYERAQKEYESVSSERASIREELMEKIYDVRRAHDKKEALNRKYEQYKGLAEGNEVIAMNFLRRAESVPEELINELCPNYFSSADADKKEEEQEEENDG